MITATAPMAHIDGASCRKESFLFVPVFLTLAPQRLPTGECWTAHSIAHLVHPIPLAATCCGQLAQKWPMTAFPRFAACRRLSRRRAQAGGS